MFHILDSMRKGVIALQGLALAVDLERPVQEDPNFRRSVSVVSVSPSIGSYQEATVTAAVNDPFTTLPTVRNLFAPQGKDREHSRVTSSG